MDEIKIVTVKDWNEAMEKLNVIHEFVVGLVEYTRPMMGSALAGMIPPRMPL